MRDGQEAGTVYTHALLLFLTMFRSICLRPGSTAAYAATALAYAGTPGGHIFVRRPIQVFCLRRLRTGTRMPPNPYFFKAASLRFCQTFILFASFRSSFCRRIIEYHVRGLGYGLGRGLVPGRGHCVAKATTLALDGGGGKPQN